MCRPDLLCLANPPIIEVQLDVWVHTASFILVDSLTRHVTQSYCSGPSVFCGRAPWSSNLWI